MRRFVNLLAGIAATLCVARAAWAADVAVTVKGIRNANGRVLVALCQQANFLQPHCPYQASAPAAAGDVHITVANVEPGVYAAQAFHDEDQNGKLERSFLGLPKEGMGFSRDAPMHFGPPRFESASFTVPPAGARIQFTIKYY